MFRPTTGELLQGVADGLRETVLPELGSGAAQRQLKSAVHVLGRLARSWDLLPAYLLAENADIAKTLHALFARLQEFDAPLPEHISALSVSLDRHEPSAVATDPKERTLGINDPAVNASAVLNLRLQAMVLELDEWLRAANSPPLGLEHARGEMDRLFERMVARELSAWDADPQDG